VHHRTIRTNHQPEATIFQFIILKFVYRSTCCGRFPAHHQELNDCSGSLWFYLRIVVTVLLCSWSGRPAGSIPDGVIGIFPWINPFGRTMALGLTQLLTGMSTRNIFFFFCRPVCRAANLTTFMWRLSWNLGAWTVWNPQGLSRPIMGLLYLYL
jgi:hypothetical protein